MVFKMKKVYVGPVGESQRKKTFTYKVGSITFLNSLCAKLGNKSRAAIYYVIPPFTENDIDVHNDLNFFYI